MKKDTDTRRSMPRIARQPKPLSKAIKLDETDLLILSMLQENARVSNAEIARRAGMVPSGILERMRKLEEQKVILAYETRVDSRALGLGLIAYVFVKAEERKGGLSTASQLAKIPEVQEVHNVAGEDCYLIKIRVADPRELGHILRDSVRAIPSVSSTRSTIVLDTIKETSAIPLRKQSRRF
jgi:Lrp/AsnC family transcriptional regulator, leucine-responsive regulatory protein